MTRRLLGKMVEIISSRQDGEKRHGAKVSGVDDHRPRLTAEELAAGDHKDFVGGLWEEIGDLQAEFLKAEGLLPGHRLVDIGCGSLRGGVRFVSYLDRGNYYGLDINASLIEAGKRDLAWLNLSGKQPNLLVNDNFDLSRFGVSFDYALAVSVFTHLHTNHIARCLVETRKVLKPGGRLFATFFEAPASLHPEPTVYDHGDNRGLLSNHDADPFRYSFAEIERLSETAGLSVENLGDWGHHRDQPMLCFSLS